MARGELSVEHVDALGRAVEATSPEAVEGSGLVRQAGRRNADQAARQVREWSRSRQSDDELQRAHQRRYAARRLMIFDGDDGMTVLHGEFDPVAGRQIRQAIGAATDRLFQADGGRGVAREVRSTDQRRADALAQLLGVDGPTAKGPDRPVRQQLLVLARLDGDGLADASLVDGTPLHESVLERLACGADLFGLVFSQGGDPLWAGRRVRLATDAQWRALIAGNPSGCFEFRLRRNVALAIGGASSATPTRLAVSPTIWSPGSRRGAAPPTSTIWCWCVVITITSSTTSGGAWCAATTAHGLCNHREGAGNNSTLPVVAPIPIQF